MTALVCNPQQYQMITVFDSNPVLDVTSSDIACNKGGESPAGLVATAAAGSKIVFDWLSVRILR